MKTQPTLKSTIAILATLAMPMLAGAANVSLIASDTSGNTSMNTVGKWGADSTGYPALTPQPTNDYFTGPFFVRTPPNNTGITFAGHSLTLQDVSGNPGTGGQGAPYRSILYKGTGGDTITINNLTNQAGAVLNNGGSGNVTAPTFTGNLWTIAGNSTIISDQGPTIIGYPIYGSANLTNSGSTQSGVHAITYTGSLSAFTGKLILFNLNGGMTVNLNPGSSNLGNPATFTPDQLTLGLGATLNDNVGILFNNINSGITLTGNASIGAGAATVISEPITDVTNGVPSVSTLSSTGAGTLVLSNANNTYSGGTTITAGILQLGVPNAVPAPATPNIGDVSVSSGATLDLNTNNLTINGLNGAGTVDTVAGGTPTLTIGNNGDNGTFTGTIQNSTGTMSVTKVGAGTETLSGGYTVSGTTLVLGGSLAFTSSGAVPSTPGNLTISNGLTVTVNSSSGNVFTLNNILEQTNATLSVNAVNTATSINAGNLILDDNATVSISYGVVSADPSMPAFNLSGAISAPGSNVVISISAIGLNAGTFTLIKYSGTAPSSLANFQLSPPPGVVATLVNNTNNHSLDVTISQVPNQLEWNGVNGTSWDLSTANWSNALTQAINVFRQYTNGSVVGGDGVTFDDTVTNSSPQPTNIVLNARFVAFPVTFNSSLPYTIAGSGGIMGATALVLSNNTGSLTMEVSNSFTGGVFINGPTLAITNDSALGASSGALTINGGALEIMGGVTNSRVISMPVTSSIGVSTNNVARLSGKITDAGVFYKADNGTLVLAANESISSDVFLHNGFTVIDSGGAITNTAYNDVGQDTNDAATLTIQGTGSLSTTSDFNLGDLGASAGTLNLTGSATLTVNALFIGSANAAGSTASGVVNQSGGTLTEVSTAVGEFDIGGRTSPSAVGVYNMGGGLITANAGIRVGSTGIGVMNQTGGTINAKAGINIARIGGSFGTNNLNGGTLSTLDIASSTATNAVFNFNGGTLQANFSPLTGTSGTGAWFSTGILAYVLSGGAIIDSSNNNVYVAAPLLAGSANGGLTKKGTGTLNLVGTNTFTGPITNTAGILNLATPSTYAGAAVVNAGTLQLTTASVLQGGATVNNGGVLALNQAGSGTENMGNLTISGAASAPGGTVSLAPTVANNPAVAMINCGTLTLNGTNTISIPLETVGTVALIKYTGSIAGSGNCTNLALPQGATGFISNSATASTLYAVITSTGPGIFWTGTNNVALHTNLWDISTTTNWVINGTPTSYHQVVVPGDSVTFDDTGSGTVFLSNNVGPTSLTISNNSRAYSFSGNGSISGPVSLLKLGTATAVMSLTNAYAGNTVISNGTLQLANSAGISSSGNLVVAPPGTVELAGFTTTFGELTGGGVLDNNSGINPTLTFGTASGATWNGTIKDHSAGGVAIHKVGSGSWIVGGTNDLNDGQPFSDQDQINAGSVVVTNGGLVEVANLQLLIATVAGTPASVVVAGGTLAVSNNVLSVGYGSGATGALTVNNGVLFHGGTTAGAGFAEIANGIDVGAVGSAGTLTVNGGFVYNNGPMFLGDSNGASGTLQLNGGLAQASDLIANATPTFSQANFNGGILQAVTNSSDFIDTTVTANIQTGGLILDDGGWTISVPAPLSPDATLTGGGLIKQGSGSVYLDSGESYTGTTTISNGFLAGLASFASPVVVAPAGIIGAGDAPNIGGLVINNNLTIQGGAMMRISVTGTFPTEDQIVVSGTTTYGGVLTVTNVTADSTPLTTAYSFQLFSVSGTPTGNFGGIAGSPGPGLSYSFNPASGILSIVNVASNPTNLLFHVSGNTLALSWPTDHLGWILQSQTNTLATGLNTNWVDVAGTSSVTSTNITMSPNTPSAFFRLRHP